MVMVCYGCYGYGPPIRRWYDSSTVLQVAYISHTSIATSRLCNFVFTKRNLDDLEVLLEKSLWSQDLKRRFSENQKADMLLRREKSSRVNETQIDPKVALGALNSLARRHEDGRAIR